MRTPTHLMDCTATLLVRTETTQTSGAPAEAFTPTAAPTVPCSFQPGNSREALKNQRDTGTTTYDVYMAPTTNTGVAVSTLVAHFSRITVDAEANTTFKLVGAPLNLISKNVVLHLIVEVDK